MVTPETTLGGGIRSEGDPKDTYTFTGTENAFSFQYRFLPSPKNSPNGNSQDAIRDTLLVYHNDVLISVIKEYIWGKNNLGITLTDNDQEHEE